jgi:hypothetical protein
MPSRGVMQQGRPENVCEFATHATLGHSGREAEIIARDKIVASHFPPTLISILCITFHYEGSLFVCQF